jgi:polysaccharide pyruvyl transferase WcaK-like protein
MTRDVFLARFVRANRGDFANQAGLLAGLRRSPQVARVFISTFYPSHFETFSDVIPVTPAPMRGYLTNEEETNILRSSLPVFWGGGVDLQDTGSKIKMPIFWIRIWLLKRFGSKFVMAFQGAGPVRTRFGRWILRLLCKLFDHAIVREPTAYRLLTETGKLRSESINQSVDSALLLDPPDKDFGRQYLKEKGFDLSRPVVGVNLRRWFHQRGGWLPTEFNHKQGQSEGEVKMESLLYELSEALKSVNGHEQVLLIPMYRRYPEMWEDDIILLEKLQNLLPSHFQIAAVEEDLSATELLSIFASMQVVVGVRLHTTIMAHVAGVPAVHIAYEHKGVEHFEMMGHSELVVPIDSACMQGGAKAIALCLSKAITQHELLSQEISEKCAALRLEAQEILENSLRKVLGTAGTEITNAPTQESDGLHT